MLRLGGLNAWQPMAKLAWRWLAARPVADLNHVPPRFLRLIAFVQGVFRGLLNPLNVTTGHFDPRAQTAFLRARRRKP
jgi:hypothetical protein